MRKTIVAVFTGAICLAIATGCTKEAKTPSNQYKSSVVAKKPSPTNQQGQPTNNDRYNHTCGDGSHY